jgi:ATP-dependent exoDNAse (exonuclease V) alpha subunit
MELRPTKDYRISSGIPYTKGQIIAIDRILKWANNTDYTPFTLSGFAGTGKTTAAKEIVSNLKGTIVCTAPTHKAVRIISNTLNIESATIQKLLGLRPNTDLETFDINKPQFDPLGNIYIKNYKYVFVDECSMINKGLYALLLREAMEYKVKIIFIGDPYQLPPVNENYSLTFSGKNIYNLEEIVRQESDNPLVTVLKMARDDVRTRGHKLAAFLSKRKYIFNDNKGFVIANNTEFIDIIDDKFSSSEFETNIDYCRYCAFTNRSVSGLNNYVRKHLFGEQLDPVIIDDLFTSYSTIMNEFNAPLIVNSEDYIIHSILSYNNKYLIKGYLIKLKKVNGGDVTENLFVINHNDVENIERYKVAFNNLLGGTRTKYLAARRTAWENFFEFKNYNLLLTDIVNENGKIISGKDLDYGFGLTIHKTQGSTFQNIIVNAKDVFYTKDNIPYRDINLRNRLMYVALSRASDSAFILF